MDGPKIQFAGHPCGKHGPYTFYKAFKFHRRDEKCRTLALGDFFLVNISSDVPLAIAELQLLWEDNNNDSDYMTSVKFYYFPKNTPDGHQSYHGKDEVICESDKIVMKLYDLVTWISPETECKTGLLAVCKPCVKPSSRQSSSASNVSSVCNDQRQRNGGTNEAVEETNGSSPPSTPTSSRSVTPRGDLEDGTGAAKVIIISYAKYCRYRAILHRLEGSEDIWMKNMLVSALGGINLAVEGMRVLFCRDTVDHPELSDHEYRLDHLTPVLKGRPRKKPLRFARENSMDSDFDPDGSNGSRSRKPKRVSVNKSQDIMSTEETQFLEDLYSFMHKRKSPIGRLPYLGFKQIDLYAFYTLSKKLGGYEKVTEKRMWKHIYDKLGGDPSSTSAATCTRRHYEKLLYPFEKHEKALQKMSCGRPAYRKITSEAPRRRSPVKPTTAHKLKPGGLVPGRKTIRRELDLREQARDLIAKSNTNQKTTSQQDQATHPSSAAQATRHGQVLLPNGQMIHSNMLLSSDPNGQMLINLAQTSEKNPIVIDNEPERKATGGSSEAKNSSAKQILIQPGWMASQQGILAQTGSSQYIPVVPVSLPIMNQQNLSNLPAPVMQMVQLPGSIQLPTSTSQSLPTIKLEPLPAHNKVEPVMEIHKHLQPPQAHMGRPSVIKHTLNRQPAHQSSAPQVYGPPGKLSSPRDLQRKRGFPNFPQNPPAAHSHNKSYVPANFPEHDPYIEGAKRSRLEHAISKLQTHNSSHPTMLSPPRSQANIAKKANESGTIDLPTDLSLKKPKELPKVEPASNNLSNSIENSSNGPLNLVVHKRNDKVVPNQSIISQPTLANVASSLSAAQILQTSPVVLSKLPLTNPADKAATNQALIQAAAASINPLHLTSLPMIHPAFPQFSPVFSSNKLVNNQTSPTIGQFATEHHQGSSPADPLENKIAAHQNIIGIPPGAYTVQPTSADVRPK